MNKKKNPISSADFMFFVVFFYWAILYLITLSAYHQLHVDYKELGGETKFFLFIFGFIDFKVHPFFM